MLKCGAMLNILIIEDDGETAAYTAKGLREDGHRVEIAADGPEGLDTARSGGFEILVVDRMLPELDGLTLVRTLRAEGDRTPVLFLTALSEVRDRVKGLNAGGDDYLGKPFAFAELRARIEALARRRAPAAAETDFTIGDLEIRRLERRVYRAGKPLPLPLKPAGGAGRTCRTGRHADHAAGAGLGLPLRSGHQCDRRPDLAAARQDRQGVRPDVAAYSQGRRIPPCARLTCCAPRPSD